MKNQDCGDGLPRFLEAILKWSDIPTRAEQRRITKLKKLRRKLQDAEKCARKVHSQKPGQKSRKKNVDRFYRSREWARVRYLVLERDGGRCQLCGRTAHDGCTLQVDHIMPRALFPALQLELSNLQTLCSTCNWGKQRSIGDFRPGSPEIAIDAEDDYLSNRFKDAVFLE